MMRAWILLAFLFVCSGLADARVGGGSTFSSSRSSSSSSHSYSGSSSSSHSYSGSSSSGGSHSWSSSGGGGGGGGGPMDPVATWFFLVVFLTIGILVIGSALRAGVQNLEALSNGAAEVRPPPTTGSSRVRRFMERLVRMDPNFSEPLFLDFVQLLYVRFQEERGGDPGPVAAYVAPPVLKRIEAATKATGVSRVDEVLVGSSAIVNIEPDAHMGKRCRIVVEIEANYTEERPNGPLRQYSRELWTFERDAGVLSKPPEEIETLRCPACGAGEQVALNGTCAYCGQVVNEGAFGWLATTRTIIDCSVPPPLQLDGGEEVGTDLPTVYTFDFDARRRAFMARHPDFEWAAFEARARDCFLSLQAAWSERRWERARPFETDHLFNTHRYWIESYRRQDLQNRLDDVAVEQVVAADFGQDAFFDSITVRIYARMKDYVVDSMGRVVGGNNRVSRRFSEYWTFVRRSDASAPAGGGGCPSCGAELAVSMGGRCEHCQTIVVSGRFDWVVSAIEQDEAYAA